MKPDLSFAVQTRAVARHELTAVWRDGRLRIAAIIVIALLLAALASGMRYQSALASERAQAASAERGRWLNQGQKNPHSAAHYGIWAFKPASPLTLLDTGVDPFVGVGVYLEAHKMNAFAHRPAQDGTAVARFGELTAALSLQVLLPLLILLGGFGVFAAERERGTLRQLLASGVNPRAVAAGKAVGILAGLGIVIMPALLFGCGALLLTAGATFELGRLVALIAAYGLYLLGWVLLTLAVSAWSRSARGALVALFAFWVVGCIAGPRLAGDVAAAASPAPSDVAFRRALETDMGPSHAQDRALAIRDRLFRQYGVTRAQDLPFDWRGISLQSEEEANNPILSRHFGSLFDVYLGQDRTLSLLGVVAPALAVQSLSQGIAGTDFTHHRRFVFAAEDHRRLIQRLMNGDVTRFDKEETDYKAGPALWATVPRFDYPAPTLEQMAVAYGPAALALLFWLGGAALALAVAIRRVRP